MPITKATHRLTKHIGDAEKLIAWTVSVVKLLYGMTVLKVIAYE